jgi:hypothetical protein
MVGMPEIPVSIGELLDKWTILQIKVARISDESKLQNILKELEYLHDIAKQYMFGEMYEAMKALVASLKECNEDLWDIEDEIRDLERDNIVQHIVDRLTANDQYWEFKDFNTIKAIKYVELARSVYITNDERCRIKRKINELLGSGIVEEKSYKEY